MLVAKKVRKSHVAFGAFDCVFWALLSGAILTANRLNKHSQY